MIKLIISTLFLLSSYPAYAQLDINIEPNLSIEIGKGRHKDRRDHRRGRDRGNHFCTVESAFDGSFSGKGSTELEAKTAAMDACRKGSRGKGFHCEEDSITCDKS